MKIFYVEILWFLCVLIVVVPLVFFVYLYQRRNFLLLGGRLEKLNLFFQKFTVYWGVIFFSYICVVLAWADISVGYRFVRRNFSGLQVVMVMDISNSMRARDILPSRLDASVKIAKNLVYGLSESQFGIVFFKGDAFVASPLTKDKLFLTGILSYVQSDMLTSKGTNLASGLLAAKNLFSVSQVSKKVIVLLSDGTELEGNLLSVIRELNSDLVSVISIGMASKEGTQIPSFVSSGKPIFSKIQENSLKIASKITNGKYFFYQDNISKDIVDHLKEYIKPLRYLEKVPNKLSNLFLLLALVGFLISLWLRTIQWKGLYDAI